MKLGLILALLGLIYLISAPFALAGAEEDENEDLNLRFETGTFETLGVAIAAPQSDDDIPEEAEPEIAEGTTLTEFVCDGTKCEKLTKKELEARQKEKRSNQPTDRLKFRTVQRILQTSDESNLYAEIARDGKPVVIQNSVLLRQWAAFQDWNFEYFANLWTMNHGMGPILVSNGTTRGPDEAIFVYNAQSADSLWPKVPKPYYETAMNLGTFFSGQCGKESKETWWWAKPFIALKDDQVVADTTPMDFFIDYSVVNKTTPLPSLVTGSRGATMQLHYDLDDTFIVQIHRRQQVFIFSPEQMRQMYVYPYIHPHRRRSQITPLLDATEKDFEGLSNIEGIEAMLEPGDVLYIPRYWGYHVNNYDPGISVHVSSPVVVDRYNLRKHLVSLAHLDPMKRLTAGKLAIKRVLEPLLYELEHNKPLNDPTEIIPDLEADTNYVPTDTPKQYEREALRKFLKNHLKQRYSKLPSYLEPVVDLTKKEINQYIKVSCREARAPQNQLKPTDQVGFSLKLDGTVEDWREIADSNVRMLLMADWVDFIAWQATGDHNHAAAFIAKCF